MFPHFFRFPSICFSLFRFVLLLFVSFGLVDLLPVWISFSAKYETNLFSFTKQTKTAWCFNWFWFEPKQKKCSAGHPICTVLFPLLLPFPFSSCFPDLHPILVLLGAEKKEGKREGNPKWIGEGKVKGRGKRGKGGGKRRGDQDSGDCR